jgi:hypothetical protein
MRFTRARLPVVAAVAAVAALAAALLGVTAHDTPAQAATTKMPSVTTALTNCSPIYSVGHKSNGEETWSYAGSDGQLYFYGGSVPRTSFCFEYSGSYDPTTGYALGQIADPGHGCLVSVVGVMEIEPCSVAGYWELIPVDSNPYVFGVKEYTSVSQCLYENTQEPAIVASCSAVYTDQFEWFYWPITITT